VVTSLFTLIEAFFYPVITDKIKLNNSKNYISHCVYPTPHKNIGSSYKRLICNAVVSVDNNPNSRSKNTSFESLLETGDFSG
jgi:hypothetical protein